MEDVLMHESKSQQQQTDPSLPHEDVIGEGRYSRDAYLQNPKTPL